MLTTTISFWTGFQTVPCTIPDVENSAFQLNDSTVLAANSEIPHNETALFGCNAGYVIQGPEVYRCWFGEYINTHGQTSECVAAPCELPRISYGEYTAGYRAGLTVANGSTVDYTCFEPNYVKINPGPIQCRLGEFIPDFPICRTRSDRFGVDGMQQQQQQTKLEKKVSVVTEKIKKKRFFRSINW